MIHTQEAVGGVLTNVVGGSAVGHKGVLGCSILSRFGILFLLLRWKHFFFYRCVVENGSSFFKLHSEYETLPYSIPPKLILS